MASGFFALLDDIAALMDDVAAMSKIAAKKTAGILGDDLAVNAEKASGFESSREIPVLWAIAKGSFINKLIIIPVAFTLSYFSPIAIIVILVLGGLFLAYEGTEKIYEFLFHRDYKKDELRFENYSKTEILSVEKDKIKSAIITDFILSVEIVIIALGTVLDEVLSSQIMVVSVIAIVATVGVYGIVGLIVRMDETGYRLIKMSKSENSFSFKIGNVLVQALPKVIKALSVIGTIALLLVAGGIFNHYIPFLHDLKITIPTILKDFAAGLISGAIVLLPVNLIKSLFKKNTNQKH